MTIKQSPEQLRDFALYGMKALQDIALRAFERGDAPTIKRVMQELSDLFKNFLDKPTEDRLDFLKVRIEREQSGPDKDALQKSFEVQKRRKDVADSIQLGKDQVVFGLAARALELAIRADEGKDGKIEAAKLILAYLPTKLQRLTEVFESATDRNVTEFWGWGWFDVVPDGKAHAMDTTSRPNRLYVVRALQILAEIPLNSAAPPALRIGEDSIYQFTECNGQSVLATLRAVSDHPETYGGILSADALARAENLAALLNAAKEKSEQDRENRLADAPLSDEMVRNFKDSVVAAVAESDRFRPIFRALGAYSDRIRDRAPDGIRSWGYNQIDEKGAFIENWHVSYSSWGESYGRGIAQGADHAAFNEMVSASRKMPAVSKGNVIPTIDKHLRESGFRDPIIFQSFLTSFEYDEIRRRDLFIASWRDDCPKTALTGFDGFIGVLKVADQNVPVVDVFSQEKTLRNRVLIANVPRLIHWTQYNPALTPEEDIFVQDGLLIRVIDLNADEAARNKLLLENPKWLQDKGDRNVQMHFLRTHVIVNVFHRMKFDIKDAEAALSFTVRRTHDELDDK